MDTSIVKHTFDFENSSIRVLGESDKPWFIAKDVCNILGLSNISQAVYAIPDNWKGITRSDTLGGEQNMTIISEAGLYRLIMKSTKKEAVKFQEWIFEEVLPTIRKTGEYKLQQCLDDQTKEIEYLNRLLKRKLRKSHTKGNCVYIVKNPDIEDKFKIGSTKDIDRRLQDYGGDAPHEYELLKNRYIEPMKQIEDIMLFIFDKQRCESDFKGTKKREWVEFDSNILAKELDDLCDYIISRRKEYDESYNENNQCDIDNEENTVDESEEEEIQTKECISCGLLKCIDKFYSRRDNVDGKENLCKDCYVQRQLQAREKKRVAMLGNKTKKCRKCKNVNHISMYKPHPTSKDGFSYICSNCVIEPAKPGLEKICSCCKILKDRDEFNNCRTSSDGKFAYCRPCNKMKNAKYKAKIRTK